jgi:hypothetical protein
MTHSFPNTSRYYVIETAKLTTADGREIVYLQRRFLPILQEGIVLAEHVVTQGERLDHITDRYLGDPEQFWQLCDANNAMHPAELTAETGTIIRVLMPQS